MWPVCSEQTQGQDMVSLAVKDKEWKQGGTGLTLLVEQDLELYFAVQITVKCTLSSAVGEKRPF